VRLLVTGGAGFIGSNFVNLLLQGQLGLTCSRVSVVDKLTYAANIDNLNPLIESGAISFILGDICDPLLMNNLISEHDVIINFAAESHVDNSILDATEFVQTNVVGVQNILSAVAFEARVRMIQVSTDEVYGSINNGSWTEDSTIKPNSPYSASKASGDLLALASHRTHALDVVITRCSNNYGPWQNQEKLIPKLILSALQDQPLTLYGNGANMREWIHVYDHCRAIAWTLLNGISGEVYNIGSNVNFTNLEIANKVLASLPKSKSKIEFIEDRLGHDFRYSVDDSKIREKGLSNEINFEDGILDTIKWYADKYQLEIK